MSEDDEMIEGRDDEPSAEDLAAPRLVDTRTVPARFHHLRAAGSCGAHARHAFQTDSDETLATRLGSGTHALVTGKPTALWDQWSDAWIKALEKATAAGVAPKGKPTKAPRNGRVWDEFRAAHPGAVILNAKEMAHAKRMESALRNNATAARILWGREMLFERTLLWSQNGRARRSTPDAVSRDGEVIVEIKTTRTAAPHAWGFPREVKRMGYHGQVADQSAAVTAQHGRGPRHVYIIAVEKAGPCVVQVYEIPAEVLEEGARLVEGWLERLQVYEATQVWSGYHDGIARLELPQPLETTISDPDWFASPEEKEHQ